MSGMLSDVQMAGPNRYLVVFGFAPNGTGTVDATTVTSDRGCGISSIVYRGATGLYTVQLVDTQATNLVAFFSSAQTAGGGNLLGYRLELDYTNSDFTKGLVVVRLVNGSGAAAATAASTGERMYGCLVLTR